MSTASRPNILIFCTDEQRADHLGCMGHPHLKTPNIDRIAAEGTLFRNCYSSSPICMPARATMMTGHTNRVHGVVDLGIPLDKTIPTLPGMLAEAGYRTHAVGKLHFQGRGGRVIEDGEDITLDPERRIYWDWPGRWEGKHYKKFPDNYYGFQTVDFTGGHVNYICGDYVTWLEENHPGAYVPGYQCSNADPHPLAIDPELHYNTWIADRTIDFIEKVSGVAGNSRHSSSCLSVPDSVQTAAVGPEGQPYRRDGRAGPPARPSCALPGQEDLTGHAHSRSSAEPRNLTPDTSPPFYIWCSFPDPHEPFAAVKTWSDFYDDVEIELPRNTLELSPDSRSATMTEVGLGTEVIDPELVKKSIKQTWGMVSHIDEQIGRVLDCLEEQGIADNTVVMFISDHGDQLGEHGLFYKSVYPYDGHSRIPFLVKVPGGVKGKVVDDVVSMLDLVPTALDLAGARHPLDAEQAEEHAPALPGEILTPVVTGDAQPMRKNALIEIDRLGKAGPAVLQMRALVTNDHKLVCYPSHGETMLFDRRNDPLELKNLADDPACQSIVTEMLKELMSELARTEMPALRPFSGVHR